MTFTDILLIVLILSILYVGWTLRARIKQMGLFREDLERDKEAEKLDSFKEESVLGFGSEIQVLRIFPADTDKINPKVVAFENQLDRLYTATDTSRKFVGVDLEIKEKELIGKMVDVIIKDTDRKMVFEKKQHNSGSKQ